MADTTFALTDLPRADHAAGAWAASLLLALARDEAAGRRPPRLFEPELATWKRFRGRLGATDLLALLFQDAAVLHPIPFSPEALTAPEALAAPNAAPDAGAPDIRRLPQRLAERWLAELPALDPTTPGADYVAEQARRLGVPTRMARSDLHSVKPHQRVLELPGTGGQLAHHLLTHNAGLTLQDNIAIACNSWQEATLAGIVALGLGAPHADFITRLEVEDLRDPDHPLRRRSTDFVVGLHPDKGGLFTRDEQLALWFPAATILLV